MLIAQHVHAATPMIVTSHSTKCKASKGQSGERRLNIATLAMSGLACHGALGCMGNSTPSLPASMLVQGLRLRAGRRALRATKAFTVTPEPKPYTASFNPQTKASSLPFAISIWHLPPLVLRVGLRVLAEEAMIDDLPDVNKEKPYAGAEITAYSGTDHRH